MSSLKKLLFISLLFTCGLLHAGTWTKVQWLTPPRAACNTGMGGIPTDYLECTLQLSQALGAGHQVTISFVNNSDNPSVTPRTVSYAYACVAKGGVNNDCNASNNTETIVLHHGGAGNNCAASGTAASGGTKSSDCATILLTAGGANYITIGRTDNGQAETMCFSVLELATTSLTPSLESVNAAGINALTQAANITSVTATGNDAIVQCISSDPTGITAPYSSNVFTQAHFGYSYALNIGSGAAPTWTVAPPPGQAASGCAVAWNDGGSQAPNPVCTPGSGTYTTAQTISCSDSVPIICTDPVLTPQTDGVSGCTVGTLYTGSIFVPISQNLNTIAGGPGDTDSSVVSYAYAIHAPYASISPSSITFSAQTVGTTSALQNITFSNSGFISSGLLIASITVTGDFAQTSTCPNPSTPLPSGGSCTVSVTFTPTTTGSRTGVLTFTDNSTGNAGTTQTVLLMGTGATAPNPGITLNCAGRCSFLGKITIQSSQSIIPAGPPLTYPARTDGAVFGTGTCAGLTPCPGELLASACAGVTACLSNAFNPGALPGHQGAALSYVGGQMAVPPPACRIGNIGVACSSSGNNINGLSSYLSGFNTLNNDPDFNTQIVRATDSTLGLGGANQVNCLGGGNFGISFHGVGAGTALVWSIADPTQINQYKIRINNSGGGNSVLAFNPTTMTVTPSDLCGGYFPGSASFSGTDPHIIYTLNGGNQENSVLISSTTGTFVTPEIVTQAGTGSVATILAVDASFVQLGPASGTPNGTGVWTGSTSGAQFTPNSSAPGTLSTTPFASTIYKGIVCDGAVTNPEESVCQKNPVGGICLVNDINPSCWYVYWTMLFNFNYVPARVGDPHFPAADDCLPQHFVSIYTGVFAPSNDGTSFTQVFGDNGQNNNTGYNGGGNASTDKGYFCPGSPDNTCQGPVYATNLVIGSGCRVLNTMTDKLTGDWGPGFPGPTQALDQQTFDIPGTLSTSPAPALGDAWTQDTTGATTQLICTSASTAGSCSQLNGTQAYVGLVYGGNASSCTNSGADATHTWRDTNGGSLTPSGCPVNAPFLYPDVMHDMAQSPTPQVSTFSLVQTNQMNVSDSGLTPAISYNATTHLTTVLWSNNTVYSPGQQFNFVNLVGSNVAYMNCTSASHCPVFTAVIVPNTGNTVCPGNGPYCPSGANGTITITDNLGGPSNYTQSQSQSACGKTCPTMYPHPQDETLANGGFGGTNFWQPQTLLVSADLRATGHKAAGSFHIYQGKFYVSINQLSPWLPTTISDSGSANTNCQRNGSPCGLTYPGPLTPPPGSSNVGLIPFSITDDQHGDMECGYSSNDFCSPILSTALVCGQGGNVGVGLLACTSQYSSLWDDEIIAAENGATRSSPGNAVGLDCVYDSTGLTVPCVYRLMHSYSSGSHYALTVQNAEGSMSSDGLFYIWPSDWNLTLGCMDGTTTACWSSWEATTSPASGPSTSWSVDSSGNVSIGMSNFFCPVNGTQYWFVQNPIPPNPSIQSISCGPTAGTVTLSGFTGATWLNGKFTLGANPSPPNPWGCNTGAGPITSVGQCTTFIGTNSSSLAHAGTSGTESGGNQKAVPTSCGNGVPCQRSDVFIAKLLSSHQ